MEEDKFLEFGFMGSVSRLIRTSYDNMKIRERYENHDCHASPMDGCETCQAYHDLLERESDVTKCYNRNGMCDKEQCYCH